MQTIPSDDHADADDLIVLPDLTLFALSEEIVSAWRRDPTNGREMLLAAMRAYPDQADALLSWVADDLHDDTLDALIDAEQDKQQAQPQIKRVAEQRATYGASENHPTEGN